MRLIEKLFTKNLKEIPLLWINFNYKYFKEKGEQNSCILHIHPNLANDQHIKETLNNLTDYIRDNYNMNIF